MSGHDVERWPDIKQGNLIGKQEMLLVLLTNCINPQTLRNASYQQSIASPATKKCSLVKPKH